MLSKFTKDDILIRPKEDLGVANNSNLNIITKKVNSDEGYLGVVDNSG